MKEIILRNGSVCLVDDSDFEKIKDFRLYFKPNGKNPYVAYRIKGNGVRGRNGYLHRFLTNAPSGYEVDHINGNGLDNRKENLRLVSKAQNARNMRVRNHSSQYKGVSYTRNGKKACWQASITINGAPFHLGHFNTPERAALFYDMAANYFWGEYAWLNYPKPFYSQKNLSAIFIPGNGTSNLAKDSL